MCCRIKKRNGNRASVCLRLYFSLTSDHFDLPVYYFGNLPNSAIASNIYTNKV